MIRRARTLLLEVVEIGEGGLGGPGAKFVQGLGIEQAVGDEDLDEVAQGHVAFPRYSAIDGSAKSEPVAEEGDDRQGSDPLGIELSGGSSHLQSLLGTKHARTFRDSVATSMPPAWQTWSRGCGK